MRDFDAWLQSPNDFERFHGMEPEPQREADAVRREREIDCDRERYGHEWRRPMSEELKRCPCCGGRAERCSVFEGPASKNWDRCTQCGLMTPMCSTPDEADARWDTRTAVDPADAQKIVDVLAGINGKLDMLLEEVDGACEECACGKSDEAHP